MLNKSVSTPPAGCILECQVMIRYLYTRYFHQIPINQASALFVRCSRCWPYLRLLHHLIVQQSHMLPYSTLYVAIVTLQCFSGIYIQQDVWWKRVPCGKWASSIPAWKRSMPPNIYSDLLEHTERKWSHSDCYGIFVCVCVCVRCEGLTRISDCKISW